MALNKRGVFLSLTSLLIVGGLFLVFSADISRTDQQAITQRVQDFTADKQLLEQQIIPPILTVYVRQSLNELASQGPVSSQEELHALLNGCLAANANHDSGSSTQTIVRCGSKYLDNSILDAQEDIEKQYREVMLYDVNVSINNVSITQIGTWDLLITADVSLRMDEISGITKYANNVTVSAPLSIEGLVDAHSSRLRPTEHTIRRFSRSEVQVNWSEQNLAKHARAGTYVGDTNASSYLGRMTGNLSESPFGIHSLVISTNSSAHSVDDDTAFYEEVCLVRVPIESQDLYLTGPYTNFYRQFDVLQRTQGEQQYDQLACQNS